MGIYTGTQIGSDGLRYPAGTQPRDAPPADPPASESEVAVAIAAILGGADADDDTLAELAAQIAAVAAGRPKRAAATYLTLPGVTAVAAAFTTTVAASTTYYEQMLVDTAITIDTLAIEVVPTAPSAGSKARLAICRADADWQPGALLHATAELAVDATGVVTASPGLALTPGRYLKAIRAQNAPAVRAVSGVVRGSAFMPALGANIYPVSLVKSEAYGAFGDPPTGWDAVVAGSTGPIHRIFCSITPG